MHNFGILWDGQKNVPPYMPLRWFGNVFGIRQPSSKPGSATSQLCGLGQVTHQTLWVQFLPMQKWGFDNIYLPSLRNGGDRSFTEERVWSFKIHRFYLSWKNTLLTNLKFFYPLTFYPISVVSICTLCEQSNHEKLGTGLSLLALQ